MSFYECLHNFLHFVTHSTLNGISGKEVKTITCVLHYRLSTARKVKHKVTVEVKKSNRDIIWFKIHKIEFYTLNNSNSVFSVFYSFLILKF